MEIRSSYFIKFLPLSVAIFNPQNYQSISDIFLLNGNNELIQLINSKTSTTKVFLLVFHQEIVHFQVNF